MGPVVAREAQSLPSSWALVLGELGDLYLPAA